MEWNRIKLTVLLAQMQYKILLFLIMEMLICDLLGEIVLSSKCLNYSILQHIIQQLYTFVTDSIQKLTSSCKYRKRYSKSMMLILQNSLVCGVSGLRAPQKNYVQFLPLNNENLSP